MNNRTRQKLRSVYKSIAKLDLKWYQSPIKRSAYKIFWRSIEIVTGRKNKIRQIGGPMHSQFTFSANPEQTKELKDCGFNILKPNEVPIGLVEKHRRIIRLSLEKIDGNSEISNEASKKYLVTIDHKKFSEEYLSELYSYFTNQYFINIATNYLGEKPLLTEMKVLHSPPNISNKNKAFSGSQLWHSDFDDTKVLKIFVYLSDVKTENGPLEIISKGSCVESIYNKKYRWGTRGISHNDSLAPKNAITNSITGPQGTIILADTVNCLHRDSRSVKDSKYMLYANYSTRTSFRHAPVNWLLPRFLSEYSMHLSSPLLRIDPSRYFLDKIAINN